ncbi:MULTISPECIES: hypothetical protein [Bosea]|uniref:hypothetical protein n=1 Tax=Bosea TaxID=85413 RepID=UPI0012E2EDD5|nr:hypothetical protein [Bosea vaviloviae]
MEDNSFRYTEKLKGASIFKFDLSLPAYAIIEFWLTKYEVSSTEISNFPILRLVALNIRPKKIDISYEESNPLCESGIVSKIDDGTNYNHNIRILLSNGIIDISAEIIHFSESKAIISDF